jgi:hypothetical protein
MREKVPANTPASSEISSFKAPTRDETEKQVTLKKLHEKKNR